MTIDKCATALRPFANPLCVGVFTVICYFLGASLHRWVVPLVSCYTLFLILAWALAKINDRLLQGNFAFNRMWSEEVAVVSGGSSGLGHCICENLAAKGATVINLDIVPPTSKSSADFHQCDCSNKDSVRSAVTYVGESYGPATILVNNAACKITGKTIRKLTKAEFMRTLEVNAFGCLNLTQQFLPDLLSAGRGQIVSISSTTAHISPATLFDYSSSKAAIICMHDCLDAELEQAGQQIKLLLVTLGQLSTQLFGGVETPSNFLGPILDPSQVAETIVEAVRQGRGGLLCLPLYASWIPLMRILPAGFAKAVRRASGIDRAMSNFSHPSIQTETPNR